jgi:undecaprenyl-diphosphatase
MSLLEALLLGLLQGLTEFLPVSSSGHLVMGQTVLGLHLPGNGFEVALHLATLLSILIVYRTRLTELAVGAVRGDKAAWRYGMLLVVATVPAAAVGLGFGNAIEPLFDIPHVSGVALLITGAILWTSRQALDRSPDRKPRLAHALLIGIAQTFALVPGISRSGVTVVTGLWLGLEAEEAATFSFLMALPAILGAFVLKSGSLANGANGVGTGSLLVGSLAAAVMGILAIQAFVSMLRKRSFHRFAPYCWLVGGAFLLYLALVA